MEVRINKTGRHTAHSHFLHTQYHSAMPKYKLLLDVQLKIIDKRMVFLSTLWLSCVSIGLVAVRAPDLGPIFRRSIYADEKLLSLQRDC